jgi:tetratricopeptide (TPR) repeat protein
VVAKRKSKGEKRDQEPDFPSELFTDALRASTAQPGDEAPWEQLEDAAASDRAREQLLDLYCGQLKGDLPEAMRELLARRAVRFAGDCFGENTQQVIDVLEAVIAALPDADWAFEHLAVAFTMTERWPELLDAHDARLAATKDLTRRKSLLDEAARIAKDFVGDQARAIGYLDQLFRLRPADVQVASSLERLLERQERWADVVQLWRQRAEALSGAQARELQRRVAVALYEKLRQPDQALAQVRLLLSEEGEDSPLPGLLERILADETAPATSRLAALQLLRERHDAAGRGARVPELLHIAIRFAEGEDLRSLRRECGERLFTQGDLNGALDQYVALACLAPQDREIEDRLRQLAEAAGEPVRLARGLTAAAAACTAVERRIELLTRAARVHDQQLGNRGEAAALFEEAIAHRAAAPTLRVDILRRLEELYAELADDGKRLTALERLAAIEPRAGEQRLVWRRAADLAAKLNELERALAAWEARLALDPSDAEALAGQVRLLGAATRWQELIQTLRRRVSTAPAAHQVRADLVEIATVARDRLGDLALATETWRDIVGRFGEDQESTSALADLYAGQGRFAELADLLSRHALSDRDRQAAMLVRLGDAQREQLGQAVESIGWYGRALDLDPAHAGARLGLSALLTEASCAPAAAEALSGAAEKTDSWELLLELLPHRLAGAPEAARRARLLEEAAQRVEARAGDGRRAFEWYCQALPLSAADLRLKREVLRLAESTGGFDRAAQALQEALASGGAPPLLMCELAEQRGQLLELQLQDAAGARASYAAALAQLPQRLELRQALVRTAARVGHWPEAAATLVDGHVSPNARDGVLLPLYESIARETNRVGTAAAALSQAAEQSGELPATVRRDLHLRAARHFLDGCDDREAATAALERAVRVDPRDVASLRLRAELLRPSPDRRLWETLSQLATEEPTNLDHLREAAELAVDKLRDGPLAEATLQRLWVEAVRLLRLPAPATGRLTVEEGALYAHEQLVALQVAAADAAAVRRATAQLLEAARLPFGDERRRGWMRRAGELTESPLHDRPGAITIWRQLLEESPDEAPVREVLARLYEQEQRFGEAVALRSRELERVTDLERRLALRLDIVRLQGLAEKKTSTAEILKANLGEQVGHVPSVRTLSEVLTRSGRARDLADVLDEQARLLENRGEAGPSAVLWAQLARLCEQTLADPPRAMAAWERVTNLEVTCEALDALGALKSAAGEFAVAAAWLDRRLNLTEGEPRSEVTVRLARAYLAAGQRHRAVAALERALADAPRAEQLRTMLADLYRAADAREQLARILAEGCEFVDDEATFVARARGAAELYAQLNLLSRAVPVLEKAVRLLPTDESLRSALAEGLSQSGRHDEARTLLLQLIEEAGWRRSRKRAGLHERLARVARQAGDLPFAFDQLEQASSMDVSNPDILVQLAEVAEATGAAERAERAYRALLMLKRKEAPTAADAASGGRAGLAITEVLLRLADLASKRGQQDQAAELLDSALAAAIGDAAEAERLQRALLERGNHEALGRLFDKRREHTAGSPAEGEVYGQMAESLRVQGRLDDAFEAQVLAVQAAPEREPLLQAAVKLARALGKVDELVKRFIELAGRRRRRPDAEVATILLLSAAQLCETDLNDLDRALQLYRRAEETGSRSTEVWSALGRVADKRGDLQECNRLVGLLKQRAAEATSPEAAADALYRAAALQLPRPDTREVGIANLAAALEKSQQVDRAMELVAAAGLPQSDLVKILPLYERVARASGDERMLFDYLDRRASGASVAVAEVREAVDLALALGRNDRVESLLVRLSEVAAEQPESQREVAWALLELVQRKKATGDFEAAALHLDRAAGVLEPERVLSLVRELSERAARAGNRKLGAQLLERLRARTPSDEAVWRPLLAHYMDLGDREGIDKLVAETLPVLVAAGQRSELRVARARFLLARDDRDPAAAEGLRELLLDEPRHPEGLALLAAFYERVGAESELIDLLEQCFELRAEMRDQEGAVQAALRLGDVLERSDGDRAAAFYERALRVAPGHPELLRRLLARTPAEKLTAEQATLLEQMLGSEGDEPTAQLTRLLTQVWDRLGDQPAVRRVLEKGYALLPGDSALAAQLEQWYRTNDAWAPLADLLTGEAARHRDPAEAAALLCEAATLRAERLGDGSGALALLRQARQRIPDDGDVLAQLTRALVAAGDVAGAQAELQAAIERPGLMPERQMPLLLLRAEIHQRHGDQRATVAVLQEAYRVSPEQAFSPFTEALMAWRQQAAQADDAEGFSDATLILADLLRARGALAEARQFVYELLGRGRTADARATRLACELAEAAGDLEGALAAAIRLVPLCHGAEQVTAAERLAELADRVGRPAEATAALENALGANPGEPRLVNRLSQLYEQAGDLPKLALLLFDEAHRCADEAQRFAYLTRAGAMFVQAGDSSVALMALNEAHAMRPGDVDTQLLLSDAHAMAGDLQESANLLGPLIAAHKGKASPALSALYVRLARLAARVGDSKAELQALSRALDADKKNGALATALADRAEALQDYDLATKALRIITVHQAAGSLSTAVAFLRQAKIAHRRGETDRAVLFARRAVQEATQGDPVALESQEFLKSVGAG